MKRGMNMKKEYSSHVVQCKTLDTWNIITTSKLTLTSYGEQIINEISMNNLFKL